MAWHSGQAYGQELRDRVLAASGSIRDVAARFAVSESYVARAFAAKAAGGRDCRPAVQPYAAQTQRAGTGAGSTRGGGTGPDAGATVPVGSSRAWHASWGDGDVAVAGSPWAEPQKNRCMPPSRSAPT
jgi:hypothetical protein